MRIYLHVIRMPSAGVYWTLTLNEPMSLVAGVNDRGEYVGPVSFDGQSTPHIVAGGLLGLPFVGPLHPEGKTVTHSTADACQYFLWATYNHLPPQPTIQIVLGDE